MDITKFESFGELCTKELPNEIDKILHAATGKNACAIGFITTDDFYGCYLTWDYTKNIREYYNWENGLNPAFLYQPLVDIVDHCKENAAVDIGQKHQTNSRRNFSAKRFSSGGYSFLFDNG